MSEIEGHFAIEHRAALSGKAALTVDGLTLRPLPEGQVLQVLPPVGADSAMREIRAAVSGAGLLLREIGPTQLFVVCGEAASDLAQRLARHAEVLDQSHGRVRIEVTGRHAAYVLAKGTAVDLATFPLNASAATLIGHIAVHLTRTSDSGFELMVLRGFAESLWDELIQMSAEFA